MRRCGSALTGSGADERVVIVHVGQDGPVEVARHRRATPGTPQINDDHFPPQPAGPLDRQPRAKNPAEAEFLGLGEGAQAVADRGRRGGHRHGCG